MRLIPEAYTLYSLSSGPECASVERCRGCYASIAAGSLRVGAARRRGFWELVVGAGRDGHIVGKHLETGTQAVC